MEKTRMNKTDKMLFRQALTEAFVRKYERELNECQETAVCSEAHTRRMQEIINQSAQRERRRDRQKWIVALLVAAALLLTACSVYAYHDEIRSFIEKVYEDYIKVTYNSGEEMPNAGKLADKYSLSYVPEGYVLTKELYLPSVNKYEWSNAEGQYITFEHCEIDKANFMLDVEIGETTIISCDKYDVYCRSSDNYTYIWNNGAYSFKITSSVSLAEETLVHMIESIQIVS